MSKPNDRTGSDFEDGNQQVDVVVVGGGQAGISLSYFLQQQGIRHLVLERERAFSAWHRRWDGFRTNTPNWMNTLPMMPADRFPSDDPHAFATREEIVDYLEECLAVVDPPLLLGSEVERVAQLAPDLWEVHTSDGAYHTTCVALCNGAMSSPRIPAEASRLSDSLPQIHSSQYREPGQIETGSVLIVGSASSGVQICHLLCESGRFDSIHMAVSDVMVLPERIVGIQTHRFLHALGFFDVRSRSLLGRLMYSGLETRGDPIMRPTAKDLATTHGVSLHSRFTGVEGSRLRFADGETLEAEDLTVIWCTGFRGDYALLEDRHRILDETGAPIHVRGVAEEAPGLYFVGLRHQHTVASHDIYGVGNDAAYVAGHISKRLRSLELTSGSTASARHRGQS